MDLRKISKHFIINSKFYFSQADQEEAGYNSEDEYNHFGVQLTEEEWIEKDRKFEQTMRKKGKILKPNFN